VLAARGTVPGDEDWVISDVRLRPLAADTYALTYHLDQAGRRTRRLTLWRHDPGGWQIPYHQGTVIEHTGPPRRPLRPAAALTSNNRDLAPGSTDTLAHRLTWRRSEVPTPSGVAATSYSSGLWDDARRCSTRSARHRSDRMPELSTPVVPAGRLRDQDQPTFGVDELVLRPWGSPTPPLSSRPTRTRTSRGGMSDR